MEGKETQFKGTVQDFVVAQAKEVEMTAAVLMFYDKQGQFGIRMANMNPPRMSLMHMLFGRWIHKDMDRLETVGLVKDAISN